MHLVTQAKDFLFEPDIVEYVSQGIKVEWHLQGPQLITRSTWLEKPVLPNIIDNE